MSCGQLALKKSGIIVENYYASEIEKRSISVTQANFPKTVQIGDVRALKVPEGLKIDLLIGGSPCQSFSFAGNNKGMSTSCDVEILTLPQYLDLKKKGFEFSGQSYLFWEFVRLAYEAKPRFIFLENVVMPKKWEKVISDTLGLEPVFFNSINLTGQSRKRLYWTNLKMEPAPFAKVSIGDIVSAEDCDFQKTSNLDTVKIKALVKKHFADGCLNGWIDEGQETLRFFKKRVGTLAYKKAISQMKSFYQNANCLTTSGQNISNSGSTNIFYITKAGKLKIRPLNPVECERLQGVPEGYTDHCSRNQRIAMLGNGWTVPVISQFFNSLKTANL